MRYRARANGNILESVPESLVGVLYDPIDDEPAGPGETVERAAEEPAPDRDPRLLAPETDVLTVAHTAPPVKRGRGRPRGSRR